MFLVLTRKEDLRARETAQIHHVRLDNSFTTAPWLARKCCFTQTTRRQTQTPRPHEALSVEHAPDP